MPLWDTAEATLCWLADCFIFLIWINKPAEKVKMCGMWVIALRRIQGFSRACGWTHNINITRAPLLLPTLLLSLQHNLIYLPVEHPNKAQWGVLHKKKKTTPTTWYDKCVTLKAVFSQIWAFIGRFASPSVWTRAAAALTAAGGCLCCRAPGWGQKHVRTDRSLRSFPASAPGWRTKEDTEGVIKIIDNPEWFSNSNCLFFSWHSFMHMSLHGMASE